MNEKLKKFKEELAQRNPEKREAIIAFEPQNKKQQVILLCIMQKIYNFEYGSDDIQHYANEALALVTNSKN